MKNLTDKEKWEILIEMQDPPPIQDIPEQKQENIQKSKSELGLAYLTETVEKLASDSAAEFLKNFPQDLRNQILNCLPENRANAIRVILSYPEKTVGAVMAKEYMSVGENLTVGETIEALHAIPVMQRGKTPYIYVLDREGRLSGVMKTADLVFHAKSEFVGEIMKKSVETIKARDLQEKAAVLFQKKRFLALPVVDDRDKLTGVLPASNMIQSLREQADRDIAKMVGTSAEELKSRSVFKILKLRMPWLFVSIASGLLCAFISGVFQASLETISVLFLFVPVVLGLSESIGIQGATIVVRNLTVTNFFLKDLKSLLLKEVWIGILVGLVCGFAVGSAAFLWKQEWILGLALSVSLNVAIAVSAFVGVLLPLLFKFLRIDPAIASGPLVLALCDIQTLLVYFTLAGLILSF